MTQFEKLDLLLRECGGTIQTFQVLNNGISKSVRIRTSCSWCVCIAGYVDRCNVPFAFTLWSSCIFS